MEKKLNILIEKIGTTQVVGSSSIEIQGIETNSRNIAHGFAFVAQRGVAVDGHIFIEKAIENGAVAIICEEIPAIINPAVCYVQVADSARACGELLRAFYEIDFIRLQVIGVTGTNGKTTTATLLYHLFSQLGYTCGLISTVCNYIAAQKLDSTHTTPDTVQLYRLFHAMQQAGCTHCFMEVSSHAIHQQRISGIDFTLAIFTNITQDHLDYHKTFAEYIKVKKQFFDNLQPSAFALINADDRNGMVMLQNTRAKKYTYSLKSKSDFKCKIIESHIDSTLLQIDGTEVWTKFIGTFNAYNVLSVYATAILLGEDKHAVLQIISTLQPVEGRTQFYRNAAGLTAVIDYAHTPDALENVLTTLKKLCAANNKIITVVGAGGNRDKTKRPLMGAVAAQLSDTVILTSDNPRDENPACIAMQMYDGIAAEQRSKVITILDRKEAIRTATMFAKSTDIILIAGKGHETYQEILGVKHHFDDKEIIQELFKLNN
jgi:UDP-N-acetylmuramoyl-L-alanyl-D-glutamate--2,6-diaminopimelate ligase